MAESGFLSGIALLTQPGGRSIGDYLNGQLSSRSWTGFRAAVAFVKRSGVRYVAGSLRSMAATGKVEVSVGVDCGGTSVEGLEALLEATSPRGRVWVYHNESDSTFHPKIFLLTSKDKAELIVGSSNLTEGGLFTNSEASLRLMLDLSRDRARAFLRTTEESLDAWGCSGGELARLLTPSFLRELAAAGYVGAEAFTRRLEDDGVTTLASPRRKLFGSTRVSRPAGRAGRRHRGEPPETRPPVEPALRVEPGVTFLMTLQQTDVGRGQVTTGASQRSPEIFIPLAARNEQPAFWDYPAAFTEDSRRPGKLDRTAVKMLLGATVVDVNMMTWPVKHDFRLRSEALRSAGHIGDVLRIERTDGVRGYTYHVTIIPKGSALYPVMKAQCVNPVRNSDKAWGYV